MISHEHQARFWRNMYINNRISTWMDCPGYTYEEAVIQAESEASKQYLAFEIAMRKRGLTVNEEPQS